MAATDALINPKVLRWARESTLLSIDEAARVAHIANPDRLLAAENGDGPITFHQLQRLAHFCRIPLGAFYRDAPPREEDVPPDFRSGPERPDRYTSDLIRTLRTARERRDAALELFQDLDIAIPAMPSVASTSEAHAVLQPLLCTLAWPDQSAQWNRGAKALSTSKEIVERSLPVLVFEFPVESAQVRGCSLFHERLSIIILSSNDVPNARRFSLTHELVHLLLHQSGLCSPLCGRDQLQLERECDVVASESLLPTAALVAEAMERRNEQPQRIVDRIVSRYGMSYSAAALRLHDAGFIGDRDYRQLMHFYDTQRRKQIEAYADRDGGPNYHLLQVQRLGPTFTGAVLDGIYSDHISVTQGASLLGVAASYVSFDGIREQMSSVYGG
ncbi:MAG: ImmA/IrrE family metallo-endopeptidase [Candidatus Eremiobacteraeota bacterium]|nr:ImmA/IrrE family metallo-endopeptidase [Candidatus Eremiobacteraeota bacterium]